jgi:hypothetical protein
MGFTRHYFSIEMSKTFVKLLNRSTADASTATTQ